MFWQQCSEVKSIRVVQLRHGSAEFRTMMVSNPVTYRVQQRKPGDHANRGYKSCRVLFTDQALPQRLFALSDTECDVVILAITRLCHVFSRNVQQHGITGMFTGINYLRIQTKCILKHEDENGCNMTGHLHISAERCHGFFLKKIIKKDGSEEMEHSVTQLEAIIFLSVGLHEVESVSPGRNAPVSRRH